MQNTLLSMNAKDVAHNTSVLARQSGIVSAIFYLFSFVHSATLTTRMTFYLRDTKALPVQPLFSIALHEEGRWQKDRFPLELPQDALPPGVHTSAFEQCGDMVLPELHFSKVVGPWQGYQQHRTFTRILLYSLGQHAVYMGFFADEPGAFDEEALLYLRSVACGGLGEELKRRAQRAGEAVPDFGSKTPKAIDLLQMCSGLEMVHHKVRSIMSTDSTVLILGETGSGKEVAADALHEGSRRHNGPFVKVNCGAIPETLIDSELFGHEKGAYTGAHTTRRGYFEQAHKGSIFLDEIGDLAPHSQARLLRVLERREIQRLGSAKGIPLDIRIIAATNRPLADMVEQGTFREDLWYRLNVVPIHIPPLRTHPEDIPVLVHHFMERKARMLGIGHLPVIHPADMEVLYRHSWPGNIRELEFVVERTLVLAASGNGGRIAFEVAHRASPRAEVVAPPENESFWPTLEEHINTYVRRVMVKTNQHIFGKTGAARLLDVHPNTLRSRLKKIGIIE